MENNTLEEAKVVWGYKDFPLAAFTKTDGTPLALYSAVDQVGMGLAVVGSETLVIKFEGDATPGTCFTQGSLPGDLDTNHPAILQVLVSKTGATDADDSYITVGAYFIAPGNLYDADVNCGGDTNAVVGTATAKTTTLLERMFTAPNIPDGAFMLNLSLAVKTLGTDALHIHAVRLKYKRTNPGIGG